MLDAREAGRKHRGERKVRVAGSIRRPVLNACCHLLAGLVLRYSDQVGAVAPRPGDVDWRFVSRHKALVGVDPLVRDQGDLLRMPHQPRNVGLSNRGEVMRIGGFKEGVSLPFEERLVCVHPRAVFVGQGLGHERGIYVVRHCDFLHHEAIGHRVIGHCERVCVAQVDLVLAGSCFVVAVLDADAHLFQREHRLAAEVGCRIERCQVEIAAAVEHRRVVRGLEVEKLQFRTDVECVAQVCCALEVAL